METSKEVNGGLFFMLAVICSAALILMTFVIGMHVKEIRDTETKAELNKMCIERSGLWNEHSKICIVPMKQPSVQMLSPSVMK